MKNKISILVLLSIFSFTVKAQVAGSLGITDTRSINDVPNLSTHSIRADFKLRDVIGVPGLGYYSTNLTIAQWSDTNNSGDKNHQLNFNNGGIFYRNAYPLDSQWGAWQQILMANENGNVGIGNSSTTNSKLEVTGGGITTGLSNINNTLTQRINTANPAISLGVGYLNSDMPFIQSFNNVNLSSNSLNINPFGGNVGIGTSNAQNKLDVNGTIHSKEVKVDMNGWSDFVFKKEYNLPTLEEVEKHIGAKGHLENIPSEEEVLKNGINLGEMNSKLLQKIEELTLYMIEMKKEIEQLKKDKK